MLDQLLSIVQQPGLLLYQLKDFDLLEQVQCQATKLVRVLPIYDMKNEEQLQPLACIPYFLIDKKVQL